ncbi:MAG: alpha/beta hydrolase, partial [Burkholderiaceae bacterium]|nr:alpha/beta hydrolase [Burkholderiaceae bacterium]
MRLDARTLFVAGLLAAVLGAVAYAAFERDLNAHRQRLAADSHLIATACGPIEYAARGSGPAALVVHGAGGGFDQALGAAAELARYGMRVIAPSRFGYLRTPLPADATVAQQADAHACLLQALGIERALVIGASAGAASAVQFALRHPQRTEALVLLVPALYHPQQRPPWSPLAQRALTVFLTSDFAYWAALRLAPESALRGLLATPAAVWRRAGADERARAIALLENALPVSARAAGLRFDAAYVAQPPREPLEKIAVPTLVIGVRDDGFGLFAAAEYTAAHIPG